MDVLLSGRTSDTGESPKDHECHPVDTSDWYFYTTTQGTLTGAGDMAGAVLEISRSGPAFQVGVGANVTQDDVSFSASGWLKVVVQPSSRPHLTPRGNRCVSVTGCRCVGRDCDELFDNHRQCRRAHRECSSGDDSPPPQGVPWSRSPLAAGQSASVGSSAASQHDRHR